MSDTFFTRPLQRVVALLSAATLAACGGVGMERLDKPHTISAANSLDSYPLSPSGSAPGASPQVRTLAASLGSGINFGDMLDAPNEGDWGLRVDNEFIDLVGKKGFTRHVRLPVRWSNHASADASAVIDPAFFKRVDWVVDRLIERGATVMLNMHHYRQLDGDPLDPQERAVDPTVVKLRFLAMWAQIAHRYAGKSDQLIFEIYNEPHGSLEDGWNDLLSRAVRVIRQTNPQRALVIGPTQWNSANALAKLVIPNDPHLILTVHHYEPFDFTHQGAPWVKPVKPVGVECCSPSQTSLITGLLDTATQYSARFGYPCFVGEFGAYHAADEASRVRYLRLMRDAMETRGLPWYYWELAANFGVYDPKAHTFRPAIKKALFER